MSLNTGDVVVWHHRRKGLRGSEAKTTSAGRRAENMGLGPRV